MITRLFNDYGSAVIRNFHKMHESRCRIALQRDSLCAETAGKPYFKWLSGIENFKAIEAAPQIMTHRILVSLRCKKVENGREAVALCNNDVAGDFAVLY